MFRLSLPTLTLGNTAAAVGGLSEPSKMPWYGWSIPAARCITGSRLSTVPGTTCRHCYAKRGRYLHGNVRGALENRFAILMDDPDAWAESMAEAITLRAAKFRPKRRDPHPCFRWFDSGDLQGSWHLDRINAVAVATGKVKYANGAEGPVRHWCPTREYAFVREFFLNGGVLAPNLTVRVSAHLVDGEPPWRLFEPVPRGLTFSVVLTGSPSATLKYEVHKCPARDTENRCGTCRACWDDGVKSVAYRLH